MMLILSYFFIILFTTSLTKTFITTSFATAINTSLIQIPPEYTINLCFTYIMSETFYDVNF